MEMIFLISQLYQVAGFMEMGDLAIMAIMDAIGLLPIQASIRMACLLLHTWEGLLLGLTIYMNMDIVSDVLKIIDINLKNF